MNLIGVIPFQLIPRPSVGTFDRKLTSKSIDIPKISSTCFFRPLEKEVIKSKINVWRRSYNTITRDNIIVYVKLPAHLLGQNI